MWVAMEVPTRQALPLAHPPTRTKQNAGKRKNEDQTRFFFTLRSPFLAFFFSLRRRTCGSGLSCEFAVLDGSRARKLPGFAWPGEVKGYLCVVSSIF